MTKKIWDSETAAAAMASGTSEAEVRAELSVDYKPEHVDNIIANAKNFAESYAADRAAR